MKNFFDVKDSGAAAITLYLSGMWNVAALSDIERAYPGMRLAKARQITVDASGLASLDTSAAWYLYDITRKLRQAGKIVEIVNFRDNERLIYERIARLPHVAEESTPPESPLVALISLAGQQVLSIAKDCRRGTEFLGQFLTVLLKRLIRPKGLRFRSIVFHINEAGLKAVPIVALMGFSLAFVTAYQGAYQLQKFDATIFTIDLVVLSTLRELGVLLAAIMLAGRSGSAFAAQLGTMKLNEEVDALQTMGVSPFEVLVMPRLISIIIALPLLTIIADMMGLLGGFVYMSAFLDYSWIQYFSRMQQATELKHLFVGLSKAPFFALLIGIVGCMQGLRASRSAEEVGQRTITAVVQAIFLVIVVDALFSVIFTKMGV